MGSYIFYRGDVRERVFDSHKGIYFPFAGASGDSGFLGIGSLSEDGEDVSYLSDAVPLEILKLYRGGRLLNELDLLDGERVDACLDASSFFYPSDDAFERARFIEALVGTRRRKRILKEVPDNLEEILFMLNMRNIPFSVDEIRSSFSNGFRPSYSLLELLDFQEKKFGGSFEDAFGRKVSKDFIWGMVSRQIGNNPLIPVYWSVFENNVEGDVVGLSFSDAIARSYHAAGTYKGEPSLEIFFHYGDLRFNKASSTLEIGFNLGRRLVDDSPEDRKARLRGDLSVDVEERFPFIFDSGEVIVSNGEKSVEVVMDRSVEEKEELIYPHLRKIVGEIVKTMVNYRSYLHYLDFN